MKSFVIESPENPTWEERAMPTIQSETDVLLQMVAVGICGSDIHVLHGKNPFATYPRVIGHEVIARVVACGSKVTTVQVGDRVIVDQVRSCESCYACKIGRPNVCSSLQVLGIHMDGGMQEYLVTDAKYLYNITDLPISDTDAVMIEPFSIAVQSCFRGRLSAEDTLLILGAGSIGASILKVAKTVCSNIIVADVFDEKLENAKAMGAHHVINTKTQSLGEEVRRITAGYGPTLAIDAACFPGSIALLLEVIGAAGRIVNMGFGKHEEAVQPFMLTRGEVELIGSRLQSRKFGEVIDLLRADKLNFDGLVSHVYPFEQAMDAFAMAQSGRSDVQKVVLVNAK